jgi:hypothetical protein
MPQNKWNNKRERQYEHIKDSLEERGRPRAKEIAARTVNKNRAQSGESDQASKESVKDKSPQQRGGQRSGRRKGPGGQTKQQLYGEARRRGIKGRSSMTKKELENALAKKKGS